MLFYFRIMITVIHSTVVNGYNSYFLHIWKFWNTLWTYKSSIRRSKFCLEFKVGFSRCFDTSLLLNHRVFPCTRQFSRMLAIQCRNVVTDSRYCRRQVSKFCSCTGCQRYGGCNCGPFSYWRFFKRGIRTNSDVEK